MFHKIVLAIVFTFAVGLVGCRSCWGPYDKCQPTFVPEAGDECMGELYRNGSILGGMQRRDGGCSECSECSGGFSDDYSAYGYEGGTMDDGTSTELPPQEVNKSLEQSAPETSSENAETIPTPAPTMTTPQGDRGSIEDFLPDPNQSDFMLQGDAI